ncbi:glutathione S-transferase Ure2-like protein [Podospora didyma]|uniref:Glutathione S-transferase Ure2-like protein n=1 Tax=Podospora didyma TaxID=330526 RepID=A0AAE0NPW3_9PEZI|nr:glutathione S-transferase Ure2-like protein [Podospora didyma]
MASDLKPIVLHGKGGPNPPKVLMLLKELGLPYEQIDVPFADVKKPAYVALNPNGRLPTIQDPNTGLTLWESGAIILYLIDRYDPDHKFSFAPGSPEAYHAQQWLFFQTTGQGPYYGQYVFFKNMHSEKVPSAMERYAKEIARVTGVLESWLTKQKELFPDGDGPWLVGNKYSYADLAWVSWQAIIARLITSEEVNFDEFPIVKEWLGRLLERPAIKDALSQAQKHE